MLTHYRGLRGRSQRHGISRQNETQYLSEFQYIGRITSISVTIWRRIFDFSINKSPYRTHSYKQHTDIVELIIFGM
jgi:hypothetical protein